MCNLRIGDIFAAHQTQRTLCRPILAFARPWQFTNAIGDGDGFGKWRWDLGTASEHRFVHRELGSTPGALGQSRTDLGACTAHAPGSRVFLTARQCRAMSP